MPNPSMCGLGPQNLGFRWRRAMSSFLYFTTWNGPPATTGVLPEGTTAWLASVFSALPLPVANLLQMCSGRIGMLVISDSALPDGFEKLTTTVFGPEAWTFFMLMTLDAQFPAAPF